MSMLPLSSYRLRVGEGVLLDLLWINISLGKPTDPRSLLTFSLALSQISTQTVVGVSEKYSGQKDILKNRQDTIWYYKYEWDKFNPTNPT